MSQPTFQIFQSNDFGDMVAKSNAWLNDANNVGINTVISDPTVTTTLINGQPLYTVSFIVDGQPTLLAAAVQANAALFAANTLAAATLAAANVQAFQTANLAGVDDSHLTDIVGSLIGPYAFSGQQGDNTGYTGNNLYSAITQGNLEVSANIASLIAATANVAFQLSTIAFALNTFVPQLLLLVANTNVQIANIPGPGHSYA